MLSHLTVVLGRILQGSMGKVLNDAFFLDSGRCLSICIGAQAKRDTPAAMVMVAIARVNGMLYSTGSASVVVDDFDGCTIRMQ